MTTPMKLNGVGRIIWRAKKTGAIVADSLAATFGKTTRSSKVGPSPSEMRAAADALLATDPGNDRFAVLERAGLLLVAADAAERRKPVHDSIDAESDRLVRQIQAERDALAAK